MAEARTAQMLGGTGSIDLPADVFAQPFNGPVVHECVVAEFAAKRQGTAATKTRGMVSGGGAKPWRQKGTGRARAGSSRSPIWVGGGTIFGPRPRHYTVKVNRKARRAALRSALSVHAERGSLLVFDSKSFGDAPSTHAAADLLATRHEGFVLVALTDGEAVAAKSFRNLRHVGVLPVDAVGVADIIRATTLVASPDALKALEARATKQARGETA